MKRPGIILLILAVLMIVTNPTKDDFFEWVETQALETSESTLEGALMNLFVSPLLKSVTVRKDYILFSTFSIELNDEETVYLGIFKQFIEM